MIGVAVVIMLGIYTVLLSPKPEPVFVTIERSGYKTGRDELGKIVLGKRPPPSEWQNFYNPSELEAYVIDNGFSLGYDGQIAPLQQQKQSQPVSSSANVLSLFKTIRRQNMAPPRVEYGDPVNIQDMPSGCELWVIPEVTTPNVYSGLQSFRAELEAYEFALLDWTWVPPQGDFWGWSWNGDTDETSKKDVRNYLDASSSNKETICETLEMHPEGLSGIFESTSSLSQLPSNNDNRGAFLEPFLPPLRHPEFCYTYYEIQNETNRKKEKPHGNILENNYFLDAGYIVHDFAAMCRNNIHQHSRTAFFDIGKPFGYRNAKVRTDPPPTLTLIQLYERFGFVFDHIYGYGVGKWNPSDALKEIPNDLKATYHDFNLGVDSDPDSYANPFKMILEAYQPNDFVVVKITMSNDVSIPLAHQLLTEEFDRTHKLSDLIDVVYLSHQVTMKEMAIPWKDSMRGASMKDSMEFFASLREHGIAAHYWI